MIKLIGFIIIIISSAKIGFDLSAKYIRRVKDLKSFISVLEKIKSKIKFSNCVISDALVKASEVKSDTVSNLVKYISKKIEDGKTGPSDAFECYLKENITFFEKNDIEEIYKFFSAFGSGDREDEIKNISNTIENIKSHLNEAIENEKKYVKLFRTSGVLAGFLIAIILA